MTSVQNPVHDSSLGVLRDSSACLSDTSGQGIHLNDKSGDDDANAFPVLLPIGVKREAGASPAEKFDACNSVDINVLNRDGFDGSWRKNKSWHDDPRTVTGELYAKNILPEKRAALSFYRLNKIERAFSPKPMNEDSVRSVSIRSRTFLPIPSAATRGVSLPRAPRTYLQAWRNGRRKGLKIPRGIPIQVRVLKLAPILSRDGFLPPSYARRQLASAISGVRFFFSRIVCAFQHQPTDSADALPGINGLSVFSPVHGQKQTMERFDDVQKDFAGAQNV